MCVFRECVSNLCVLYGMLLNSSGNLQILPMGNLRHFPIIRKNDTLFLKMYVFRRNLVILLTNNEFPKKIPDFFGVGMGEGAWEMSMK